MRPFPKPDPKKPGLHPSPTGESKVQKQFAEETDIRSIWKRFKKTGYFPPADPVKAIFTEVPAVTLEEHLNRVVDIQNAFQQLPAKVRDRFMNNPVQLARFLEKPENHPEAVKLGLMKLREGFKFDEKTGQVVEQLDLEKEAEKSQKPPEGGT